jgi:hypothetical protein
LGEDFKEEINKAEANALLAAKSIKCIVSAPRSAASDRQVGKAFEDEAVVGPLSDLYTKLSSKLPSAADKLLLDSYELGGCLRGQVTLASLQSRPFGPYAAPIHKLMVAHAMKHLFITYECAEVSGGPVIGRSQGGAAAVIKGDVIVRHGAHSNLETLLEHEERESLKIRQFLLADYIDKDKKQLHAIYAPKKVPTDPLSIEYIRSRYDMASSLVGWLKPGLTLTADANGYHLDGGTLADCKLGTPTELFEIPVRASEPPTHRLF